MRNKGKVYPSPSSSSSSASSFLPESSPSIFKLLPAAILALAAVLSLEERQVLAYMITRSIKSTDPSFSSVKNKKKSLNAHKSPVFDCECFDCYTSYWFKWDSSPNRELIHQAIEAFEDHLNNGEQSKKKGKKRYKMGHHRLVGKAEIPPPEVQDVQSPPKFETPPLQAKDDPDQVFDDAEEERTPSPEAAVVATVGATATAVAAIHHKGLPRMVLPDVLGLLNSRIWSLWGPNV